MGYSYTADHRLCCDLCDHPGGVRKYRCPFDYCQAVALCPKCRGEHPELVSKAHHRELGCEAARSRFVKLDARRRQLLDGGHFVRCSAMAHDEHGALSVKVLFEGTDGKARAYWMGHDTYDAIPLLVPATPADYRKHGQVVVARNTHVYDAELEAVAT